MVLGLPPGLGFCPVKGETHHQNSLVRDSRTNPGKSILRDGEKKSGDGEQKNVRFAETTVTSVYDADQSWFNEEHYHWKYLTEATSGATKPQWEGSAFARPKWETYLDEKKIHHGVETRKNDELHEIIATGANDLFWYDTLLDLYGKEELEEMSLKEAVLVSQSVGKDLVFFRSSPLWRNEKIEKYFDK